MNETGRNHGIKVAAAGGSCPANTLSAPVRASTVAASGAGQRGAGGWPRCGDAGGGASRAANGGGWGGVRRLQGGVRATAAALRVRGCRIANPRARVTGRGGSAQAGSCGSTHVAAWWPRGTAWRGWPQWPGRAGMPPYSPPCRECARRSLRRRRRRRLLRSFALGRTSPSRSSRTKAVRSCRGACSLVESAQVRPTAAPSAMRSSRR